MVCVSACVNEDTIESSRFKNYDIINASQELKTREMSVAEI